MSKVLSGEALSGFKRWQVPDVAIGMGKDSHGGSNKYLTAVQLERIQKQAYDEAYARGLREGTAAGQAQIKDQAKVFIGMANYLQNPLKQLDENIESEILILCMAIAKQIIRREITIDPGHIISIIREALSALPASSHKVRIFLHPEDVLMVRNVMTELNEDVSWSIVDDITISRGGCKVTTENSQIDATLEARMSMIASKLLIDERSNDKPE